MAATKNVFTPDELETLFAAFDTFLPSISPSELLQLAPNAAYADEKALKEFAEECPSTIPNIRRVVVDVLAKHLSPAKAAELKMALNLLRLVNLDIRWNFANVVLVEPSARCCLRPR